MPARLRRLDPADLPRVVELSLRAWESVFASLRAVLGDEVFLFLYPDWRSAQAQAVTVICTSRRMSVSVAVEADAAVGFVAFSADQQSRLGVIEMLAVDPDRQGTGVGTALTSYALAALRDAGMHVAMVETGGDPGHAPARRTYDKAGCTLLPIARYFKPLSHVEPNDPHGPTA